MLHPILETLFFLKIARESICDSITESEVENKDELKSYIRKEASDYEVMHLLTLGEMPEEKYNVQNEQAIWSIFKEEVIMNTESLREEVRPSDIMNIVYEMGPVSELGYSSAAPILEFDRANGRLDLDYLNEERGSRPWETPEKELRRTSGDSGVKPLSQSQQAFADKQNGLNPKVSNYQLAKNRANYYGQKATSVAKDATKSTADYIKNNKGKSAAGAAVAAAGLYGLYKLYKSWKAKKAAAKTPAEKTAAEKGMAKVQSRIRKKKAKK